MERAQNSAAQHTRDRVSIEQKPGWLCEAETSFLTVVHLRIQKKIRQKLLLRAHQLSQKIHQETLGQKVKILKQINCKNKLISK
jgi:hypothetical protein